MNGPPLQTTTNGQHLLPATTNYQLPTPITNNNNSNNNNNIDAPNPPYLEMQMPTDPYALDAKQNPPSNDMMIHSV
ncbi:hypothetical protein P167DRAFT_120194 [Morchella conica CCBAS932]|uniref:Uncharacterized protein n=1 Tax=Morchella conica CCBAS932 TaxID=1392247 RepID=A0A3N4L2W2_9PEZI|nr:hypothetical protein P167DRAFT_120194 [Morchella conica CCBAS932]